MESCIYREPVLLKTGNAAIRDITFEQESGKRKRLWIHGGSTKSPLSKSGLTSLLSQC